MAACDILVSGTGGFAARIAFDIAATTDEPVEVVIAGRNRERLNWLRTAANARAALFGKKARFTTHVVDLLAPNASDEMLAATGPRIVVQAASIQTSQVIAQTGNAWTQLVAEGGLSATAVFQALLSSRVAAAITRAGKPVTLINCGFPDVVNGMIKAMGHDVACGMGNVAILANVFAGSAATPPRSEVKVLAHYQNLAAWRRRPCLPPDHHFLRVVVARQHTGADGALRDALFVADPIGDGAMPHHQDARTPRGRIGAREAGPGCLPGRVLVGYRALQHGRLVRA